MIHLIVIKRMIRETHLPSRPNEFTADDMRRGQSFFVWAIREGRLCARSIDQFLMGTTNLPR